MSAPIMRWFDAAHLPEGPIRWTSEALGDLARELEERLDGTEAPAELATGLRKLLEAKDAFVRAAVAMPTGPERVIRAVILEGGPLDGQSGSITGEPPAVAPIDPQALGAYSGEYRLDPERVSNNGAVYVWTKTLDLPPGVSRN